MAIGTISIEISDEAKEFLARLEAAVTELKRHVPDVAWSRVDPSSPPEHKWYWCYVEGEHGPYQTVGWWRGYGDWIDVDGDLLNVTHYRPLMPKPESEEA
jgi:hypothetical protein